MITPETPLEKLEAFFAEQQAPGGSKVQFALVTDAGALEFIDPCLIPKLVRLGNCR